MRRYIVECEAVVVHVNESWHLSMSHVTHMHDYVTRRNCRHIVKSADIYLDSSAYRQTRQYMTSLGHYVTRRIRRNMSSLCHYVTRQSVDIPSNLPISVLTRVRIVERISRRLHSVTMSLVESADISSNLPMYLLTRMRVVECVNT